MLASTARLAGLLPPGRYPAGHVIEVAERVPGHDVTITLRCTLTGRSRLGGREMAVFTCDGTTPFSTRDAASGVTVAGSIAQDHVVAVDTETTAMRRNASLTRMRSTATGRPGATPVPIDVTVNLRGRLD
jgi:hypothetical protein